MNTWTKHAGDNSLPNTTGPCTNALCVTFHLGYRCSHRQEKAAGAKGSEASNSWTWYMRSPSPTGKAPTLLTRALRAFPILALEQHSGTRSVGFDTAGTQENREARPQGQNRWRGQVVGCSAPPPSPARGVYKPADNFSSNRTATSRSPEALFFTRVPSTSLPPRMWCECPQGEHLLKYQGAIDVCVSAGTGPGTQS